MPDPLDALDLDDGMRLAVVAHSDGRAALPMLRTADGQWRRARSGEGVAEALLRLLAEATGTTTRGSFTIRSWTHRIAVGERSIGVDQTNESVIVGDAAVVKWATHLQDGPHPAPRRIAVLRDAGFGGIPQPWGLVTWRQPDGAETLVASVDQYLPGAVDGWTWAVQLITDAARDRRPGPAIDAARDVAALVAELHAALASTATVATMSDAQRWRDAALNTLESVCSLEDSHAVRVARARRGEVAKVLDRLGELGGSPVIEGHGDLHVGQILRADGRFVVTDFDGNPVLQARERILPIPAALDVAGMVQSLSHAAVVARKYTALDPQALAEVDTQVRAAFLDAYTARIGQLGHAGLYDPDAVAPFRTQQVLREIIYAASHLPRWMYVPDAALPALLGEGIPT
ncbi:glucosamine kinase [Mycolicibacterium agri]|uniref:Glucosamine kinase n=2 Tax=Mycolicibacterium agri TaxID=36811 RepID=A0A7I9W6I3_MYCAG|nr:glucosamine kinase [Mycolicibacterium agri]GFG52968.1 hypothetical protein MAGR_44090 [Mycolicibacterium agri]